VRAGQLRHRVKIQSKSITKNGFGEDVVTWNDVGTYWCKISPKSGREFTENRSEQAEVTHVLELRDIGTITNVMRAYWPTESKTYDILAVIKPDERNIFYRLQCREVLNG
jgi:SPP1 family predicted phage head-tail adaptor